VCFIIIFFWGGAATPNSPSACVSGGVWLQVPDDYDELWTPAYATGARIHSNSWGSGPPFNFYDSSVVGMDDFV